MQTSHSARWVTGLLSTTKLGSRASSLRTQGLMRRVSQEYSSSVTSRSQNAGISLFSKSDRETSPLSLALDTSTKDKTHHMRGPNSRVGVETRDM